MIIIGKYTLLFHLSPSANRSSSLYEQGRTEEGGFLKGYFVSKQDAKWSLHLLRSRRALLFHA